LQVDEKTVGGNKVGKETTAKAPFVADKVGSLPDRKYAVIVEEAHGSQSGETAKDLKGVLPADSIKQKAKLCRRCRGSQAFLPL
jgi:type I restriction enzyme R subunit